ncbi:MAG: nucleotide sugar dehydrogenase [Bhargavaea sp.]
MEENKIAVIGLGYVGLPLALELAKHYEVVGFDLNQEKVSAYRNGIDVTGEAGGTALNETRARFTFDEKVLKGCNFFIVTVPTPLHPDRTPNLEPVKSAFRTVGKYLSKGAIVVLESTVYPGTTEEICVPILEETSGLALGTDFKVGYSPERINPGDKTHTLSTIVKIVSASDEAGLKKVGDVYRSVVKAGVYEAPSIKVAEAAKVIENAQRDVNIAFMNELSMIFNRMGIDTAEVLKAAGTKWNFLHFSPGLVGGHCIGVDPHYLVYKAELLGLAPLIVPAGRTVNEGMAKFVADQILKELLRVHGRIDPDTRVGILGFTFKENSPDSRNTKVADIARELMRYGFEVIIHDPHADPVAVRREYGLELAGKDTLRNLDAVVVAVGHDEFRGSGFVREIRSMLKDGRRVVFDLKTLYPKGDFRKLGLEVWSL